MRVGVLIGPFFEDSEYLEPVKALKDAGHELIHISNQKEKIKSEHGKISIKPDMLVSDAKADDFDALLIPGGFSPDMLRKDEKVINFVKDFFDSEKPIFAICHGPQLLMAAERFKDRKLTAWPTVQHDLELAGANVIDEPIVEDENLITSRGPDDLSYFNDAIVSRLSSSK